MQDKLPDEIWAYKRTHEQTIHAVYTPFLGNDFGAVTSCEKYIRADLASRPAEVTVEQFRNALRKNRFKYDLDDNIEYFIRKEYPNGIRIVS